MRQSIVDIVDVGKLTNPENGYRLWELERERELEKPKDYPS